MAKQAYITKRFSLDRLVTIQRVNDIVEDLQSQGFRLTTRQIYYQLVAAGHIPNTIQSYKNVADTINDGKLAGLIDWEAIEDRTRSFSREQRWDSGAHILDACIRGYHQDMWVGQASRVFVLVEKDALKGVLEPTCRKYDVPLLAARGYPSGTVLREFAESDLLPCLDEGLEPIILHLGDHDPSGIDMSRDLSKRFEMFCDYPIEVRRIALNMDQVLEVNPPPNPAKSTDARFAGYAKEFGHESWELDALSPSYLVRLLSSEIEGYIDHDIRNEVVAEVKHVKSRLAEVAKELR
jgi:hypothetical protein